MTHPGRRAACELGALQRRRPPARYGRGRRRRACVGRSGGPPLTELRVIAALSSRPRSSRKRDTVVSGGEDGTLRRWTPPAAATVRRPFTGASSSPDGRHVVGGRNGRRGAHLGHLQRLGQGAPGPRRAEHGALLCRRAADRQRELGRDGADMGCGERPVASRVRRRAAIASPPLRSRRGPDRDRQRRPNILVRRSRSGASASCSADTVASCATWLSAPTGSTSSAAPTTEPSDSGTRRPESPSGPCEGMGSRQLRGLQSDGEHVLSAGTDATVRIWSVDGDHPGSCADMKARFLGGVRSRRRPRGQHGRGRDGPGLERRRWRDARGARPPPGTGVLGAVHWRRAPGRQCRRLRTACGSRRATSADR